MVLLLYFTYGPEPFTGCLSVAASCETLLYINPPPSLLVRVKEAVSGVSMVCGRKKTYSNKSCETR